MPKAHITADDLFRDDDLAPTPVDNVPGFETTGYISTLAADERDELEELWRHHREDDESVVGFRAFVVAYCICDPDGRRLFSSDKIAEAARRIGVGKKAAGISRLFNVACKANGLLKEDVDELEKKSVQSPPGSGN